MQTYKFIHTFGQILRRCTDRRGMALMLEAGFVGISDAEPEDAPLRRLDDVLDAELAFLGDRAIDACTRADVLVALDRIDAGADGTLAERGAYSLVRVDGEVQVVHYKDGWVAAAGAPEPSDVEAWQNWILTWLDRAEMVFARQRPA